MRNLFINARSPWLNGLRRLLFSLLPVRRMVLRHHAAQVRRSIGMVIQEVSLPFHKTDLLDNAKDAARQDSLAAYANTVAERTSKPHRFLFVSFLVPEPFVEVEVSEEWVRANPKIAAEAWDYALQRIEELEGHCKSWKELSQL